jgi:hypothetical protein
MTETTVDKEPKFFCKNCGNGYITRSGLSKHSKKCKDNKGNQEHTNLMNAFDNGKNTTEEEKKEEAKKEEQKKQEPSAMEKMYLEHELQGLYIANPTIRLDRPVNLDYVKMIRGMSVEELKMRILEIKQNLSTKLDRRYSDCGIRAASFLVGSILGIEKELTEVNSKDELLGLSAQETLSFRLGLFALPAEVKLGGIFTLNVVDTKISQMRANKKKNDEKKKQQQQNTTPQPAPKEKQTVKDIKKENPKLTENEEFSCFA